MCPVSGPCASHAAAATWSLSGTSDPAEHPPGKLTGFAFAAKRRFTAFAYPHLGVHQFIHGDKLDIRPTLDDAVKQILQSRKALLSVGSIQVPTEIHAMRANDGRF